MCLSGPAFDHCAGMVRAGDAERFACAMAAPPVRRGGLMALYAFNLEIARAPWSSAEPLVAEMRLQWWIDALETPGQGQAGAHPVMAALAATMAARDLPQAALLAMAEARRFDISRDGHATRADFDAYIAATSGQLLQLAARVLAGAGTGAGAAAVPAGILADYAYAGGVARLWRALPELLARGRNPLPVATTTGVKGGAKGAPSPDMAAALQAISTDALARLARVRKAQARVPRTLLPVLLPDRGARAVLETVARDPAAATSGLPEPSPFARRAGRLLRHISGRWV